MKRRKSGIEDVGKNLEELSGGMAAMKAPPGVRVVGRRIRGRGGRRRGSNERHEMVA